MPAPCSIAAFTPSVGVHRDAAAPAAAMGRRSGRARARAMMLMQCVHGLELRLAEHHTSGCPGIGRPRRQHTPDGTQPVTGYPVPAISAGQEWKDVRRLDSQRSVMAEFRYEDMLPIGEDTTPYRLLTTEGVETVEGPDGRTFLKVAPEALELLAETAMHDIAHYLRPAHLAAAAQDPRRPGGQPERQVRRARPAEERQHRRRRRPADVPGHRHRDRHGQARPAGAHRRAPTSCR